MSTQKEKTYGIFYKIRGKTYGLTATFNMVNFSSNSVAVFRNLSKLDLFFRRAIRCAHAKTVNSLLDMDDALLSFCTRHGKVFVARFGSNKCPVKTLRTFAFNAEGFNPSVMMVIKE